MTLQLPARGCLARYRAGPAALYNSRNVAKQHRASRNHVRPIRVMADGAIQGKQIFARYLQGSVDNAEFCRSWAEEIDLADKEQAQVSHELSDAVPAGSHGAWQAIRQEAAREAAGEPILSSFLFTSILAHDSFERSLAFVLSNRLSNATMIATQLFEVFLDVLANNDTVRMGALADVEACRERDPSCGSYSQALLYYKGFHAIQTHRIAHCLWHGGHQVMALMLQSRASEVFAVDIHPAARVGRGVFLDQGTGVVIGETAVIGDNCSLLQNITLGGTGKQDGDRHPKIGNNVIIGASSTILGNIVIGAGAQVAAGSLVLKPVAPHTMVAGSPASPVGTVFRGHHI